MIYSKNKISKVLLAATLLFGTLVSVTAASTVSAMETIFVTANQKTGRYSGPIYVKLTASSPDAKIWYTCKRDGTPSDLIKYESPILLTKSCALIYFAYVTNELESKIERTDFTILYSDKVKLETNNNILQLRNTDDTSTVDIGGWELIAGTGGITIPPGTSVTPWATYIVGKVDPASYELKSPEGYTKSQVSVIAPVVVIPPKKPTNTPVIVVPVVTDPKNETPTLPTETPTIEVPTTSTETPVPTIPSTETPTTTTSGTISLPTDTGGTTDLTNIKASATESKNTSALPIAITLILLGGGAIVGKQLQKKNQS